MFSRVVKRFANRLPNVKRSIHRRIKPIRPLKPRQTIKRRYSTARHFQIKYPYTYRTNFLGLDLNLKFPIVFHMYGNDNMSNRIESIIPNTMQELEKRTNILSMVYDRNKVIESIVKLLNEDLEYNDFKSRCENVKLG